MNRREAMFNDDFVGVFLDTFNDRQRAYMFLVSPFGIQLDGIVTEGQDDDFSFDTIWQSRGELTDFGYVVSIAIPFKSLRFPPASGPQYLGHRVHARDPRQQRERLLAGDHETPDRASPDSSPIFTAWRTCRPAATFSSFRTARSPGRRFLDRDLAAYDSRSGRTRRCRRKGRGA